MDKNYEIEQQDLKERLEHRDVLLAIQALLVTKPGKDFIKYLFKNFDVAVPPEFGLSGELLHDRIGFLRAGNSIFKIVAESSPEMAGSILAQIEKEKYDQIQYDQTRSN